MSICEDQNYTWEPNIGFDAKENESGDKIQIKTRRSTTGEEVDRAGRINRFFKTNEPKDPFKTGVLVILNRAFEITEHYRVSACWIKELESMEKSGSGLHVSTFQNFASIEAEENSCKNSTHKTADKKKMRKMRITAKTICRLEKLGLDSESLK